MADRQYVTQLGRPAIDKAFDGLRTITRLSLVKATATTYANIEAEVFFAYGTADVEFPLALLTTRKMDQANTKNSDYELRLTEVYTEFTSGSKVNIGQDQITVGIDGRTSVDVHYVALASEAAGLAAAIGTVLSGRACSNVQINKQGVGAEIIETYISAGQLSQSDSTGDNGALLMRTITSFNAVPTTPTGYTLTDTSVTNTNGVPTYTYKFAQGTGQISKSTDYSQSQDQGTTGVTRVLIRYLTIASVGTDPTTLVGFVKVGEEVSEQDGYRIWNISYAKGYGLVHQKIQSRQDGLRLVTNISLGVRTAPVGIVVHDYFQLEGGYTVYTVSSMQDAAGGSNPTTVSLSFDRWVPFTYPGRAKAFTEAYDTKTFLSCFLSPPVATLVLATVTISYQISNSLGTIANFWNPSDWATVKKQWVGSYGRVSSQNESLHGYRSVDTTPVTLAGSATTAIDGGVIYTGTTARIVVTGGPADPGGATWTLHAELEPAFTDISGTKYYRKTIVTAAIPAQAALPV